MYKAKLTNAIKIATAATSCARMLLTAFPEKDRSLPCRTEVWGEGGEGAVPPGCLVNAVKSIEQELRYATSSVFSPAALDPAACRFSHRLLSVPVAMYKVSRSGAWYGGTPTTAT